MIKVAIPITGYDEFNSLKKIVFNGKFVSGKNVEIFTSTGEYYIKTAINTPVTPTGIRIIATTSYGSKLLPKPKQFDNATVFVQNNGKNVREFLFNE